MSESPSSHPRRPSRPNRVTHLQLTFAAFVAAAAALLLAAAPALAAPALETELRHYPTNIAPGETGIYMVTPVNVGDAPTAGTTTLTVELRDGLTTTAGPLIATASGTGWTCPTAFVPGADAVICTSATVVGAGAEYQPLTVWVTAGAGESGTLETTAEVTLGAGPSMSVSDPTTISADQPGFGVSTFAAKARKADGSWETQLGGRPYSATTSFDFNTTTSAVDFENLFRPVGSTKDIEVDLPPGFVGNPLTVSQCLKFRLYLGGVSGSAADCPRSSQVGMATVRVASVIQSIPYFTPSTFRVPVFNLIPDADQPAAFGFNFQGNVVMMSAGLRSDGDYGLKVILNDVSQGLPLIGSTVTFWGTPAHPSHDAERGGPAGIEPRPFLANPTDCDRTYATAIRARSWENPGAPFTQPIEDVAPPSTGCEKLDFSPRASLQPTSSQADSPTGLDVEIEIPQTDAANVLATAHLRDTKVVLPEGMSVNPSTANGLASCSPAQVGLVSKSPARFNLAADSCPAASKVGSVSIDTPLLADPLSGSVYVAQQAANPFDSLLALYLVADGPGIIIKLAGEIALDQSTGQLTATFLDNPPLPFEQLRLRFKDGSRAPLINPSTCGTHTTTAEFSSWAGHQVSRNDTFQVSSAPNGQPCAATSQQRPFNPAINAGLRNAVADSYSPFILNLSRPDGHQELAGLNVSLPEGVTAKLAGVSQCADATLNAISDAEGSGSAENASPSCPANSQVGVATVGAGAGANPYYVQTGKAYLAGPYKGAQLSLAVVVPALAGPFDLGTTVVRNKLNVDKRTAQVSVESDPLPRILHGIPLKLRDIRVNVNRAGFMRSGTNCEPMQITSQIKGSHGKTASPSNRFQVGDCASLGFSPKLKLGFGKNKKNTKPNAHPPLNANLSFNEGDSNISRVEVALPQGVLLDQERIGRICSRANYAANTCPEESRVGYAKATTPLLDDPVEGPVYLKASDNPLPDLAADLNGQIDIDLFGKIDQKQNKKGLNQIRNTFDVVPDVPVSSFQLTLDGGSDGLLVNSRNICKSKAARKVSISMSAHNNMSLSEKPLIGSACKNKKPKGKKKGKRKNKRASLALRELGR